MTGGRSTLRALRNVSLRRIISALERDGFQFRRTQGSQRVFRHADGRRVVIHFHHPGDVLPPHVLRTLLAGTRWTGDDLRRLKLI